jgi:lipoate-protein ligase B
MKRDILRDATAVLLLLAFGGCTQGTSVEARARSEGHKTVVALTDHLPAFTGGLAQDQKQIQPLEQAAIGALNKSASPAQLVVYLNRYGEVRWHAQKSHIGKTFDELTKTQAFDTDAIEQAYVSRQVKSRVHPSGKGFDVAVPVLDQEHVLGILFFSGA